MKKQIYVAIERCLGCRSCELACAVAHSQTKDLLQAMLEAAPPQARVEVGVVETFAVPLHCRHCEDAPCITVCPSHAMSRSGPDEPVVCQGSKCIGCTLCVLVCPFGVLKMDRAGKVIVKCDLCQDLLADGKDPACVTACPTGAIRFISTADFSGRVAGEARADMVAAMKAGDKTRMIGR
jgi:anaerobic carbon-monoxide dehydrogenase iron sulfur subunit